MLKKEAASIHDYASKARELIQLVTDLRALGAQADFDLPRIAVIGNQSAGKSSLVEAIAKITVPRDSGTCTRCPMECRLSYSESPWQCQVLLRIEKDEDGAPVAETKELKFGTLLTDPRELEPMLRRAQLAILNPSLPHGTFTNYDLSLVESGHIPPGSQRQLQFSANVVCLDLSGPDVPDLSFIDLPGLISNVDEGEDRNNIDLVRSLVEDHIKGNALILLTITMRDDIQNQSAAFLARQADPDGQRTIGALTKPDTLQNGEEVNWIKVLEGRSHQLRHGYFVTKQLAMSDLKQDISHEEARQREKEYFTQTPPWKDLPGRTQKRLGVPKLSAELSKLLSQLIEQTLPTLRQESKNSLSETRRSLDDLPPPPSENPTQELMRLIASFSQKVQKVVDGAEGEEDVIQVCRASYSSFKSKIKSTTPVFFASNSVEGESESIPGVPRYLDEVKAFIEKSLTRQLPLNVPDSVKRRLIDQCFEDWPMHSTHCFTAVWGAFGKQVQELIGSEFGRFKELEEAVRSIMDELLENIKGETSTKIAWLHKLDQPPFTLNDHYFTAYRAKFLAQYREDRHGSTLPAGAMYGEDGVNNALSALSAIGYNGLAQQDLQALRGPDEYEQELIVMAEVRAYFQVAYKRVIDMLPLIIDHDFLRSVSDKVQDALIGKLGIGEENSFARHAKYLREDVTVTSQREELTLKKRRLEEMLGKLLNFSA